MMRTIIICGMPSSNSGQAMNGQKNYLKGSLRLMEEEVKIVLRTIPIHAGTMDRGGGEPHTAYYQTLPNAHEAAWYIMKGDPHWDDKLWTTMKHLYKGGMWFKKKSVLQAEGNYSTEHGPVGLTDLRTKYETISNNSITQSPPAPAVADNYFYLPVLGNYYGGGGGEQSFVGKYGYYWTSSSFPESLSLTQIYSWVLSYGNDGISLGYISRYMGMRAQPFSDFGDN